MTEKAATLVERFWPIIGGAALCISAFALTGATAARAETLANKVNDSVEGRDGMRERLTRMETKIDILLDKLVEKAK